MVVRNHSYPAGRRNVMLFVSIAVLPGVVKWLIRRSHEVSACSPVVAQSPDGFFIIAKFEKTLDLLTVIIAVAEYGGGLSVLAFCYVSILATIIRSRQRVKGHEDVREKGAKRIDLGTSQEDQSITREPKRSWTICRPIECYLSDETCSDSTLCLCFRPGTLRSNRPTGSGRISPFVTR